MRAFLALASLALAAEDYKYFLTGNRENVSVRTQPGFFLSGGGRDVDDAWRWFLKKAGGGDIVILRASGADGYHGFPLRLGVPVDSVESIVFLNREASSNAEVLRIINNADALFFAGGDQWNYVRFWKGTPVEDAIHAAVKRGIPIGGTSAGLAILGEFGFSAEKNTVTSKEALADPFHERVTISRDFLRLPHLHCLITDSHFTQRSREGRLLVFMARIKRESKCKTVRAIGIDERTAVLLEADGQSSVAGENRAIFYDLSQTPKRIAPGRPAEIGGLHACAVAPNGTFDLKRWSGNSACRESIAVRKGEVLRRTTNE
ncbi:MAG: cyanophycinase [Acidobacteria bacterium]|nr:cyanophycinase [Acidobacteriota bacterium]